MSGTTPPRNEADRPPTVRSGLIPRVIYFPAGWLQRVESRGPGALIELLTVALSNTTKGSVQ